MILDSHQCEAFYVLTGTLNFTAAAKKLLITQSALSQRIQLLEEHLQTRLFIRDRNNLRLTEQGRKFLQFVKTRKSLEDTFLADFGQSPKKTLGGSISIGAYSTVLRSVILPVLSSISRENPETTIHFIKEEIGNLPTLMRNGTIDLMILDREWTFEGIKAVAIGEEQNVLIQAKKHLPPPNTYLDNNFDDDTTFRFLNKPKETIKRVFLDDCYGIIDGVEQGMGRAVMAYHLVKSNQAIKVLKSDRQMTNPVVLHYFENPYRLPLHQVAIDALTTKSKKYLF